MKNIAFFVFFLFTFTYTSTCSFAHGNHSVDFAVQAVQMLKDQIKQDPKNVSLRIQLGHFYSILNQLDDARKELNIALDLQSANDEARLILARVLIMQQKQKDALSLLNEIKDPAWKDDAKITEGTLYFQKGNVDASEKAFLEAKKADPKNSDVYINLGGIAKLKKDYKKAEEYFKTAVKLDSSNVMAYGQLSMIYGEQKKTKEKIAVLKKMLQLLPQDSPSYKNIKAQLEKEQK